MPDRPSRHAPASAGSGIETAARLAELEAEVACLREALATSQAAQEALARSEARFRAVADLVPDLLWSNDLAGRAQWHNRRWTEYTGLPQEQALGDGWLEVVHPDDRAAAYAAAQAAFARGEPLEQEHRLRRRDGSYRWFLARTEPVRDAGGAVVQWFGAATDIHEQRTTAEALRGFAQSTDDVLWIADITGQRLEYLSPAFEQVWGEPRDAVMADLGRWAALLHPEDRERAARAMGRALEGERVEEEYRIVRPSDGAVRWIRDAGFPILGPDGRVCRIAGVARDVTARREADERQELLLHELSHRVRNTLAVVQSMAWQSGRRAVDLPGFLAAFESRLEAMAAAHGLLTVSHWQSVPLSSVVREALAPHHEPGDGRIGVELAVDPSVSPALAQDLVLALHELATNAAKHGALSVTAGRVTLTARVEGDALRMTWCESGGPPVRPPRARGFGTTLLERIPGGRHGGRCVLDWRPEGLRCVLLLPLGGLSFPEGR
jgi:PAS domain S-box-containing protein